MSSRKKNVGGSRERAVSERLSRSLLSLGALSAVVIVAAAPGATLQARIADLQQRNTTIRQEIATIGNRLRQDSRQDEIRTQASQESYTRLADRQRLIEDDLDALRTLLPEDSINALGLVAQRLTPPMTVSDYYDLMRYSERLAEAETRYTALRQRRNEIIAHALELQQLLMPINQAWILQVTAEISIRALEEQLAQTRLVTMTAYAHNWSWGTEIALYLFGFKWLWGAFTLYAPTGAMSSHDQALRERQSAELAKLKEEQLVIAADAARDFANGISALRKQVSQWSENNPLLPPSIRAGELHEIVRNIYDSSRITIIDRVMRDIELRRYNFGHGMIAQAERPRDSWLYAGLNLSARLVGNLALALMGDIIDPSQFYNSIFKKNDSAQPPAQTTKPGQSQSSTTTGTQPATRTEKQKKVYATWISALGYIGSSLGWWEAELLSGKASIDKLAALKWQDFVASGMRVRQLVQKTFNLDILNWMEGAQMMIQKILGRPITSATLTTADSDKCYRDNPIMQALESIDAVNLSPYYTALMQRTWRLAPTWVSTLSSIISWQRSIFSPRVNITTRLRYDDPIKGEHITLPWEELANLAPLKQLESGAAVYAPLLPDSKDSDGNTPGDISLKSLMNELLANQVERELIEKLAQRRALVTKLLAESPASIRLRALTSPALQQIDKRRRSALVSRLSDQLKTTEHAHDQSQVTYDLLTKLSMKAQEIKLVHQQILEQRSLLRARRENLELLRREDYGLRGSLWDPTGEALLYIVGLKWLWGVFTGYAATHDRRDIQRRLSQAESDYKIYEQNIHRQVARLDERLMLLRGELVATLQDIQHQTQDRRVWSAAVQFMDALDNVFTSYDNALRDYNSQMAVDRQHKLDNLTGYAKEYGSSNYRGGLSGQALEMLSTHSMSRSNSRSSKRIQTTGESAQALQEIDNVAAERRLEQIIAQYDKLLHLDLFTPFFRQYYLREREILELRTRIEYYNGLLGESSTDDKERE